jgi:mRNA-degrading endonuclease toxin of MazEF toxin-antitoxin module
MFNLPKSFEKARICFIVSNDAALDTASTAIAAAVVQLSSHPKQLIALATHQG